ncbi:hypothetical protein DPMN_058976 [Dreissena polymorpha]|uniref:Uncharacterized protein n=1 Tax=Dreissena polymorpha TaxID=45954 RepID=A0A9D4C340_DREPO|nr:hypothetical protein DPMN_058976 [Dreissena polymorpha]
MCRARIQLECQATLVQAQTGLFDASLVMHRLAQKGEQGDGGSADGGSGLGWVSSGCVSTVCMTNLWSNYDERTNAHSSTS